MARKKERFHGILLLDKPAGMTSNQALQAVKRLLQVKKAGHTGSLDPLATGLLPICIGEATKISPFLLLGDKRYDVWVRLGRATDTGDADGRVTEEKPVPDLTLEEIEQALCRFRGEIEQIPPMYSAVKKGGRRLYELARRGIEVEREPRRVKVYELRLTGREPGRLRLDIYCSKGTFIRALAEEIARALGTVGHVEALRRTEVGRFKASEALPLDELRELPFEERKKRLLPVDSAISELPEVQLSRELLFYITRGQPVMIPRLAAHEGPIRLYDEKGRFVGVGEVLDDGRVAPRRLLKLAA